MREPKKVNDKKGGEEKKAQVREPKVNGNHLALLAILGKKAEYHGQAYCYPSIKYMQHQLKVGHGIERSIRTLEYWLKRLERDFGLKRTRRNPIVENGTRRYSTTLYRFNKKALNWLYRMRIDLWDKIKGLNKKWEQFPWTKKVAVKLSTMTEIERERSYASYLRVKNEIASL